MNEEWQSVLLRVGDIHFSDVLQPSPSAKMALCSNCHCHCRFPPLQPARHLLNTL